MDGGATWSTWYNQPTAQMYHVTTDNRFPYAVMGAQQDSGTAAVWSRTNHWGIDARDWFPVGGAESGYIAADPKNDNILYVSDTYGKLFHYDRRTSQAQDITPSIAHEAQDPPGSSLWKYRFPWTAPLVFSPSEPGTLYYGSQYVLKTTDGGLTWKEISPDLTGDTRKDKSTPPGVPVTAENARAMGYGVVYAIGPSPLRPGLIWAGSDTGLIHVTRDGGQHWQNVTPPGLPDWSRVTQIEASHFSPGTAYVTVDRHRMEDYKPYVYRTRDYGATWSLVTEGLAEPSYMNGIREDPARKGLLYGATETSVAVSFDEGDHWQSLRLNLPTVSVRDLVVHGDDLVIATFGRGFWILDDITPLRQADAKSAATEAFLYKPATAIRLNPQEFSGTPFPLEEPQAKNPPAGAVIDYYLKSAADVTVEIRDARGQLIRHFASKDGEKPAPHKPVPIADAWLTVPSHPGARPGMNRFEWDLRYALPATGETEDDDEDSPPRGPMVMPGQYRVRLTVGGATQTQPLTVKLDPRSQASPLDLSKQFELSMNCLRALEQAHTLAREMAAFRKNLAEQRKDDPANAEAVKLESALSSISSRLTTSMAVAQSADRMPPATAFSLYEQAARDLASETAAWKKLRETSEKR